MASCGSVLNGPCWRHQKRGTTFTEVCRAELQASTSITEDDVLVVYRSGDGKPWACKANEFEDGRFELVKPQSIIV